MEREALAALEKRVSELRVMTAEKAVLARSLANPEPMKHRGVIATAILAIAVFAAFLIGRELGIALAIASPCRGMRSGEFASIKLITWSYSVTLDTNGNVARDLALSTKHPGMTYTHVAPSAVRALADRLTKGCLFENHPGYIMATDVTWTTVKLRVGNRTTEYRHTALGPIKMCGSHEDLYEIENAIAELSGVRELLD